MPQDPRLAAAAAASNQQAAQAVSALRAMTAQIQRDHAEYRRERAERDRERAERARAGEAGPEAQETQRRVDRGETSWDDVVHGRDDAPEAQALAGRARDGVDLVAAEAALDTEVVEAAEEARLQQARVDDELRRG